MEWQCKAHRSKHPTAVFTIALLLFTHLLVQLVLFTTTLL